MHFAIVVSLYLIYKGSAQKWKVALYRSCARPSNHHPLLHLTATTASSVDEEEGSSGQSSSPSTSLPVHNASVTDSDRGFVLLKAVPVRVVSESGLTLSTYGLLDTDAVSFMINSRIAAKLELQRVPERVSLNTVTHTNHTVSYRR